MIGVVHEAKAHIEYRVHRAQSCMMLDRHVRNRKHTAGEILRRGNCALQGIRIETNLAFLRLFVLCDKPIGNQTLAEVLSHYGFQLAAAQRQFTGSGGPGHPFVGRDLVKLCANGGTDIMAAQNEHFLQLVLLMEGGILCGLLRCLDRDSGQQQRKADG